MRAASRSIHRVLSYLPVAALTFGLACTSAETPMPMGDGGLPGTCMTDPDCDDGIACNGRETCTLGSAGMHCEAAPVPLCLSGQTCDEAHHRCTTTCSIARDADGDGHDAMECGGDDCNDADAHAFPGNTEVCDVGGHDEDCDPTTYGVRDADGDGEPDAHCCNTDSAGHMNCGTDCDDQRSTVHPGQAETCNMRDDDCDTAIDEDAQMSFYPDVDHDGFGDGHGMPIMACSPPPNTASNMGDCDDMLAASNPSAPEICDGIDNNCDGQIDEGLAMTLYPDADRDGFGDAHAMGMLRCPAEGFVASHADCDDTNPAARPGLAEVCDGIDNNCDGQTDEGLLQMLYPDLDGDGDGSSTAAGSLVCPGPHLSPTHTDCDDGNRVTFGGAPELCDSRDNDCDTRVDESTVMVPWYPDADGDGFGNPRQPPMLSCTAIAGRSQLTECDDNRADVYPGAPQLCDRVDNTCVMDDGSGHAVALVSEDVDNDMHSAPSAACAMGFPRDDCDDTMAIVHPGAPELCDLVDQNCSSGGGVANDEDMDGDGHTARTFVCTGGPIPHDDCDDARAATHPGATETCDRIDDDCSSGGGVLTAEDADMDGYSPASAACTGGFPKTDCDDTRATVHPGVTETCDMLDDDCSGVVDDGCPISIAPSVTVTETRHLHDSRCAPGTAGTASCGPNIVTGVDLYEATGGGGVELNAVRLFCASVGLGTSGTTGMPTVFTVPIGTGALGSTFASIGGTRVQLRCPAGTAVTRTRLGGHELVCQPLAVTGAIGSFAVTATSPSTTVGTSTGTSVYDLDPPACTDGYVVIGVSGTYCSSIMPAIASLDAVCSQLVVSVR